jgi:hypothetical protein
MQFPMVTSVRIAATKDAKLLGVMANDLARAVLRSTEGGHLSVEVQVVLPLGQTGKLIAADRPTSPGAPPNLSSRW